MFAVAVPSLGQFSLRLFEDKKDIICNFSVARIVGKRAVFLVSLCEGSPLHAKRARSVCVCVSFRHMPKKEEQQQERTLHSMGDFNTFFQSMSRLIGFFCFWVWAGWGHGVQSEWILLRMVNFQDRSLKLLWLVLCP